MSGRPLVAVPIKPFSVAKARLEAAIAPPVRRLLSTEMAGHTIESIDAAGAEPLAVVSDEDTRRWADRVGVRAISDGQAGLSAAAQTAVRLAISEDRPWAVCHADLPLLSPDEVSAALDVVRSGSPVLAPSSDGGTSFFGWTGPVRFAYGTSSFHRHLARLRHLDPVVLVRTGFLLDIDEPADLSAARFHQRGAWVWSLVESRLAAS